MMPKISVIMPVYNVEKFVTQAINAVLTQSFTDFELIIINDCSTDNSLQLCQKFTDKRIVIVNHECNKGLAAARNTGIRHAKGKYLAFLDSDDAWHQDKLQSHVTHLDNNDDIGISFSRSAFMDYEGHILNIYQMPQLIDIDAAHLLCRNPVGNGSAPVVRKITFDDIAFISATESPDQWCYFDESFRQSEDIECWLRIVATTQWQIEGLSAPLTYYRLNHQGLSSNFKKQLASWEKMIDKARLFAPELLKDVEHKARAYQLRYLARQAIRNDDGKTAVRLVNQALYLAPSILKNETGRTLATLMAAYMLYCLPLSVYKYCEKLGHYVIGNLQKLKIKRDEA
ncbi:glycosyltransferase family 2 protein [Shewanella surugensis]|uniref:Glycosyltransferase family 2 protein n=1 Tax=Shewanella surugensis TaxID=212020 RepID=A0ABT0LBN4_9GAMM|nr:glycosyltransferase family 2 protein [Shewanella surugensis]MCL1124905.1 glycosyltransferase family 2 protein [Shewanella surugensis]